MWPAFASVAVAEVGADQGGVGLVAALAHDGVVSLDQRSTVHGARSERKSGGGARGRGARAGGAELEAQAAAVGSRARRIGGLGSG